MTNTPLNQPQPILHLPNPNAKINTNSIIKDGAGLCWLALRYRSSMKKILPLLIFCMFFCGCTSVNKDTAVQSDWKTQYWQAIFALIDHNQDNIVFLKQKIHSKNVNEKMNAILLLTKVHVVSELQDEFIKMYWNESNVDIKRRIIQGLTFLIYDLDKRERFFLKVKGKERNKRLLASATEALEQTKFLKENPPGIKLEEKIKSHNELYSKTYKRLFSSYGKEGNIHTLAISSTLEDIDDLFKLNERISKRQSDEALYDIMEISQIISEIRLMYYNFYNDNL